MFNYFNQQEPPWFLHLARRNNSGHRVSQGFSFRAPDGPTALCLALFEADYHCAETAYLETPLGYIAFEGSVARLAMEVR